jgi:hypothetical protein
VLARLAAGTHKRNNHDQSHKKPEAVEMVEMKSMPGPEDNIEDPSDNRPDGAKDAADQTCDQAKGTTNHAENKSNDTTGDPDPNRKSQHKQNDDNGAHRIFSVVVQKSFSS